MDALSVLGEYTFQIVALGTALLGLTAGITGTFSVLRHESLIGDGLSHASLPGVVLAFLLTGIKDSAWLLFGASVSALLAALLMSLATKYTKIRFDAALATVLSAFFGLGMVLLTYVQSLNDAGQAGLSKFIFGQAATMVAYDVLITSVVAVLVICIVGLSWKELVLTTFDREYARTLGMDVNVCDVLYRFTVILTIIIGIQSVGAILISSLLIAPAVGARQWTNRIGYMTILAGLMGAIACVMGTIWSTLVPKIPTGPAIIVVLSVIVIASLLIRMYRKGGSL